MATKKKTKSSKTPKKSVKKPPAIKSKEADFLDVLIYYTKQNIKNDGSSLDEFFKGQLDRLTKRLKELS
jgi:hypothetical protein